MLQHTHTHESSFESFTFGNFQPNICRCHVCYTLNSNNKNDKKKLFRTNPKITNDSPKTIFVVFFINFS